MTLLLGPIAQVIALLDLALQWLILFEKWLSLDCFLLLVIITHLMIIFNFIQQEYLFQLNVFQNINLNKLNSYLIITS